MDRGVKVSPITCLRKIPENTQPGWISWGGEGDGG